MKVDTIKVEKTVEVVEDVVILSRDEALNIIRMLEASVNSFGNTRVTRLCPNQDEAMATLYDISELEKRLLK